MVPQGRRAGIIALIGAIVTIAAMGTQKDLLNATGPDLYFAPSSFGNA